ncbi:MAG: PQQ-dependent sugar dehydrogenase [Dehalococcoidia bacterium]
MRQPSIAWVAGALLCALLLAGCAEGELATLEPAFGGHVFDQPVELIDLGGGRFLVAERAGRLWEVRDDGRSIEQVLDLTSVVSVEHGEHGFLSMALDPEFETNRHLWTFYVRHDPLRAALVRYTWPDGREVEHGSELIALEIPQPAESHAGGSVRFGPDGMLYLGVGDGRYGTAPDTSQDPSKLFGSIIRIDVRGATAAEPYRVPPDNPHVGVDGARHEIWAIGFRNPWRMSFEPEGGALWVGDVGAEHMEEVDVVERGGNYGWAVVEGTHCREGDRCNDPAFAAPVHSYNRDVGCAVTGGIVYRGAEVEALRGRYVFGDFCEGDVWALTDDGERELVVRAGTLLVSIAVDRKGELYLLRFYEPIMRLRAK